MDESKEDSTKLALPAPPDEYHQENGAVKEILDNLQQSVYLEEMLAKLKKLAQKIDENPRLISILLYHYYINIDSRHSMRTSILRILNNSTKDEKKNAIMREALFEYFDKYIMTPNKQIVKPVQIQQLHSLFTNIPFGLDALRANGKDVLIATLLCFEELTQMYLEDRTHKLHMSLYSVVKLLVSIVQKNLVNDNCRCTSSEQLGYIYELIIDNSLHFDIRCNAGILFVFYSTHNIKKSDKSLSDYPFLTLMGTNATPVDMFDVLQKAVDGNTIARIALYAGLIIWAKEVHLNTPIDTPNGQVYLGEHVFGTLIDFCEQKGYCWIPATRIMLTLCRVKFVMRVELFRKIMRFCEQHMDHSVDTVRHSMKNLYKQVLSIASKEMNRDLRRRYLDVVDSLVVDIKNGKMYHYIIPIAEEFGCQYILSQIPNLQHNLIELMGDETISQQIYSTYRSLMSLHHKLISATAHYKTELPQWRSHWISALSRAIRCELAVTNDQSQVVAANRNTTKAKEIVGRIDNMDDKEEEKEDAFVPQYLALFIDAFRLDKGIIYLLGPVDMRCESQLEALLKCLHQCYKEGIKTDAYTRDYTVDYPIWRDLIPCYVLERVRSHRSPTVRIAALSLIVDTGKTCASYTAWETSYLRRFYAMHAREPNAAARHQMLALFERAIKRAGDSREVAMRRITILDRSREKRLAQGKDEDEGMEKEFEDAKKQESISLRFINSFYYMAVMYATKVGACHGRITIALHIIAYLQRTYQVGYTGPVGGCGAEDDDRLHNASVTLAQGAQRLLIEDGYETIVQAAYMVMVRLGPGITRSSLDRSDHHTSLMTIIHLACSIRPCDTISAAYQLCELLRYDDVGPFIPALYPALGIEPDNQHPENSTPVTIMIGILIRMVEVKVHAALGQGHGQERNGAFYGLLGCVRVLMKEYDLGNTLSNNIWRYFVKLLIPLLCHRIPALVSPIIGDNAPEGFLPYEAQAMDDIADISADSQMILVYAWRSVKEVSLLLGEVADRCPYLTDIEEDFEGIGSYFVNVFQNAKHRGAYEQASVGFQQVCKRLWNLCIVNVPWPVTELVKIKFLVDNQAEEGVKKLCPTRRSAGIPFMVQTILATEPKQLQNKHFNETTEQLIQSCDAQNAVQATKLHGMNILRALVRHNELGEKVIPYVGDCVILALRSFDHQSFAIRNCATLLFSALMTRMFGVQRSREHISKRNQMTYCGFLSRHAKLAQFLLSEMQKLYRDANTNTCQDKSNLIYMNFTSDLIVQPILMILCRLYNCNDSEHIDIILPFLQVCASNSNFKTRELACEVTTTILRDAKQRDHLDKVLAALLQVQGPCNGNYLHGLLLQMSYLFNAKMGAICEKLLDMDAYIQATSWIAVGAGKRVDYCSATEYLELCHHFVKIAKGSKNIENLMKVLMYQCDNDTDCQSNRLAMKVKYCTTRLSLIIYILLKLPRSTDSTQNSNTDLSCIESIARLLAKAIDPVRCEADTALFILTFLNAPFARSSSTAALYTTGELAVPSIVKRLCQAVIVKFGLKGPSRLISAFVKAAELEHIAYWMKDGELYAAGFVFMVKTCTHLAQKSLVPDLRSFLGLAFKYFDRGSAGIMHAFCIALVAFSTQAVAEAQSNNNNHSCITELIVYLPDLLSREMVPTFVKVAVFNVCVKLVEYAKKTGLDIREFVLLWNVIINLLEDEDEEVRNHATLIYKNLELPQQSYPNTPECTIEVIYQHWSKTLPSEMALIFVMYRILFSDSDRTEFLDSIEGVFNPSDANDQSDDGSFGDTSVCHGPDVISVVAHLSAITLTDGEKKKNLKGVRKTESDAKMKVFPENQESFHYHESDFNDAEAFKYFKNLIFDIPNFNFDKNQIFVVERLQLATNKLRTLINALKTYMPVQLFKDLVIILAGISDYLDLAPVEEYDNNVAWKEFHKLIVKQCGDDPSVLDTHMYNLLYHVYCFESDAWEVAGKTPLGL